MTPSLWKITAGNFADYEETTPPRYSLKMRDCLSMATVIYAAEKIRRRVIYKAAATDEKRIVTSLPGRR